MAKIILAIIIWIGIVEIAGRFCALSNKRPRRSP